MTVTLENDALRLKVIPDQACWSVASRRWEGLALEQVQIGLSFHREGARHHILAGWPGAQISERTAVVSPHGPSRQLHIAIPAGENGLECALTFALPENVPFLFWSLAIQNAGARPVFIDRLDLLAAGLVSLLGEVAFFSNGWQSWSYTGAYVRNDRFRKTRLGPLRAPTDVNPGTPQPAQRGRFASDMFGVLGDRDRRVGVLAGFLSQMQHFGSLEADLNTSPPALRLWANGDGARLNPGSQIATDMACLHFLQVDHPDPLGPYLAAVARQHGLDADPETAEYHPEPPTGWCSWYQFSTEDQVAGTVTARDIRANLAALRAISSRLPLKVLQIDDGFESQVGDWFSFHPGFPEGVAPLATETRAAGFTPGLWLAPFIVHPSSTLAADRPGWLLRNRFGRPVNAGYLWGTFATALDLTHPEALEYTRDVVSTAVHEWGFPYLKLDFLYAAALPGRYRDPTRTRAQVLRSGLETLRAAAGPEGFLLGCGCPLGPAIGLVDAMRVGTDVARRWSPAFKGREFFLRAEPNLPAARNAAHNTLTRAALHHRWWINDPDCLLLRPQTRLTLAEVQTVATAIALTGGSLFLSDHLPDLPLERLRIAEALLPLIGRRPQVLDWLDRATPARLLLDLDGPAGPWRLLALFNWESKPVDLVLRLADLYPDPPAECYAREFWTGEIIKISATPPSQGQHLFQAVPPHSVVLLAVRPCRTDRPHFLGSDLHISQGLEISAWDWDAPNRLRLQLNRPGPASGRVDLAFPRPLLEADLDGAPLRWKQLDGECYRFEIQFDQFADLHFRLQDT